MPAAPATPRRHPAPPPEEEEQEEREEREEREVKVEYPMNVGRVAVEVIHLRSSLKPPRRRSP